MKIAAQMMSGLVKLSLALTLAVSASVSAAPIQNTALNLSEAYPDIQSDFLTYDLTGNSFDLSGFATLLSYSASSTTNINNGSFSIAGTFSGLVADLDLLIRGDIGSGLTDLLSGDLSVMSDTGSGILEFIFDINGGSLASLFGSQVGVIYSHNNDQSNTFSVSAPSTFSLSVLGLLLLAVARRKFV